MNKQIKYCGGEKMYLLGKNKLTGKKVWLVAPSWDCDWYWGFGYLEQFNNRNNLESHTHFDSQFFNRPNKSGFDAFNEYFSECVLTTNEIWELLDYMRTFYSLKNCAGVFHRGGSHYTDSAVFNEMKDDSVYNLINHEKLPALFKRIDNLLKGDNE